MFSTMQMSTMEFTDKQMNVLIVAGLARQYDVEESGNENGGFRPLEWLLPNRRQIESVFQPLVRAGLLEVDHAGAQAEESFRITDFGMELIGEF